MQYNLITIFPKILTIVYKYAWYILNTIRMLIIITSRYVLVIHNNTFNRQNTLQSKL